MTFKPANPNAIKAPPRDLMEETEKLVTKLVRNTRAGRVIKDTDAEGKTTRRRVPYDIIDQVRAAESALKFLQVKNKLDPEKEETEFDEQLKRFHGQGSGGADPGEDTASGRSSTAH